MKTDKIILKCSPEEKMKIIKRADQLGMGMSAYLRMLALKDIAEETKNES